MTGDTPTGRTRYRLGTVGAGLFSRGTPVLILQVEVVWGDGPDDFNGMPTYLAGKGWRDAQVTDFASLLPTTIGPTP